MKIFQTYVKKKKKKIQLLYQLEMKFPPEGVKLSFCYTVLADQKMRFITRHLFIKQIQSREKAKVDIQDFHLFDIFSQI